VHFLQFFGAFWCPFFNLNSHLFLPFLKLAFVLFACNGVIKLTGIALCKGTVRGCKGHIHGWSDLRCGYWLPFPHPILCHLGTVFIDVFKVQLVVKSCNSSIRDGGICTEVKLGCFVFCFWHGKCFRGLSAICQSIGQDCSIQVQALSILFIFTL